MWSYQLLPMLCKKCLCFWKQEPKYYYTFFFMQLTLIENRKGRTYTVDKCTHRCILFLHSRFQSLCDNLTFSPFCSSCFQTLSYLAQKTPLLSWKPNIFLSRADILQSSSTQWSTGELSLLSKLLRYIYEPASVNKASKLHLSPSTWGHRAIPEP